MKLLSFKGGIHPPHNKKYTEHKALERAIEPKIAYVPLQQHIGAPAKAIVNVGDEVKVGQKIGEMQGFVSANVHAPVSGKVKSIGEHATPGGSSICVLIENDFKNEIHESVKPKGDLEKLSKEEILEIIKEAGIVGMGGATFPTHVKLSPPPDKKIDTVVLNGAECEPYLTADHRLMLESPENVVDGLRALMKALNVEKGYIGIENNKPDCIEVMTKAAKQYSNIEVVGLETKYPQGAEKQLIYACTKKEVPSGGLPMETGVVVTNVGTSAQVAIAIKTGMPLIERITTITGNCIQEPKNMIVKIGTPYSEVIEQCGGFDPNKKVGKVISGGPMMGIAQTTIEVPITKGSSGILCLDEKEGHVPKPQNCIRCGKCVDICPAFLQPLYISAHSIKYDYENAESYRALDCIECGSCSFICPARRPLLPSIRVAKREIVAIKRKQQASK